MKWFVRLTYWLHQTMRGFPDARLALVRRHLEHARYEQKLWDIIDSPHKREKRKALIASLEAKIERKTR